MGLFGVDPRKSVPTKSSAGSSWLEWYKNLKSAVGKKQANDIFLKFWAKRGTSDANTHALREYLSKNGVDIEKGIFSSLYDTGAGIFDWFGGIFGTIKWVAIGIVVVVIGTAAIGVINVSRSSSVKANFGMPPMRA